MKLFKIPMCVCISICTSFPHDVLGPKAQWRPQELPLDSGLSVCLSVCLSDYLIVCLHVFMSIRMSVCQLISCMTFMDEESQLMPHWLSGQRSVCLCVCVSVCASVCVCSCLSVYLSICLSVSLSVCL